MRGHEPDLHAVDLPGAEVEGSEARVRPEQLKGHVVELAKAGGLQAAALHAPGERPGKLDEHLAPVEDRPATCTRAASAAPS